MSESSLPIIVAEKIGKSYRIWKDPSSRLKAPLVDAFSSLIPASFRQKRPEVSPYFHDFAALKDVSFTVGRGETLGIIGRNGSGKSTLLQIICGTLQPTSGEVTVRGRVAALLELGSGFNPEFTGRENVFLNASILGVTKAEVDARLDEILAFADIGEFIDQPVKTYSSGMMVRLAFAVSVCIEPDLLIVDEALSVGDVFFQQKCFARLRELQEKGVSLLFVSHDMGAVRNLCDRCILLNKGDVVFDGSPEIAVSKYYTASSETHGVPVETPAMTSTEVSEEFQRRCDEIMARNILPFAKTRHGNGGMHIVAASVKGPSSEGLEISVDDELTLALLLEADAPVASPSAGIHLFDRMNNLIFAAGTRNLRIDMPPMVKGEKRLVEFTLRMAVQPGQYTYSLGCSDAIPGEPNNGVVLDRIEGLGPVSVMFASDSLMPFHGVARLPMHGKIMFSKERAD